MTEEKKEKRPIINQDTLIPLSMVIMVMGGLIAGSFFMGSLNNRVAQAETRLDKVENALSQIPTMSENISVIKVQVEQLNKLFASYNFELKK